MIKVLEVKSSDYPPLLKQIYDPPNFLYYRGNLAVMQKPMIAIVGTRGMSTYGEFVTKKIVDELAVLDVAIVSGLAKGIDTVAHTHALASGLPTVAVLGSGLKNIYPQTNLLLSKQIEANGVLLSQYSPDTSPKKYQFPERNRIISGLSIAVIVIEAPEKSGALITARTALEQNREVFAVPGDIDRPNSAGIISLFKKSMATPISSGRDIVDLLKEQPRLFDILPQQRNISSDNTKTTQVNLNNFKLSNTDRKILTVLSKTRGKYLEDISHRSMLPISKLLTSISKMEISGLVLIKNQKYFRTI